MSDQHFPTENEDTKPGGSTGSVHDEAPLIRKEGELTPEQYECQRNNLVLMALLVVLIIAAFATFPYIKAALLDGIAFLAPMADFAPLLFWASAPSPSNLPRKSHRGLAGEYCIRVSSRMLMSSVGKPLTLTDSPERTPPFLCRTITPAYRCRHSIPMDS